MDALTTLIHFEGATPHTGDEVCDKAVFMFGVCRFHQLWNAAASGSLAQDLQKGRLRHPSARASAMRPRHRVARRSCSQPWWNARGRRPEAAALDTPSSEIVHCDMRTSTLRKTTRHGERSQDAEPHLSSSPVATIASGE